MISTTDFPIMSYNHPANRTYGDPSEHYQQNFYTECLGIDGCYCGVLVIYVKTDDEKFWESFKDLISKLRPDEVRKIRPPKRCRWNSA